MKCRICAKPAAINLRQHHISYCSDHFNDWMLKYTAETIRKFSMLHEGERVLVAVSGGKDSLALWDILVKLGYKAEGLYIHLGIEKPDEYSSTSEKLCHQFADQHGVVLHVYNTQQEIGASIPALLEMDRRGDQRPCSICGLIKRRVFNSFPRELGINVVATGHNLDDEAAVLLTNNLSWNVEQMARQSPVMDAKAGFTRKVKPFVRFYERETAAYALINQIEYIEEECPFAVGSSTNSNKLILNNLETMHPGLKLAYYSQFLKQKKAGLLNISENQLELLHICPSCGEMTSNEGECAYCKLIRRANQAVSR